MKWTKLLIFGLLSICINARSLASSIDFNPNDFNGEEWLDTDGNRINCHGGCILKSDSTYYWYGEHRPGFESSVQKGVACYSSQNLKDWTNEGIVLEMSADDDNDPAALSGIIERPKVIYCQLTGKYVMWFHHELKGRGYEAAHAAVAQSDSPIGPFHLIQSSRVNPGKYPLDFSETQKNAKWSDADVADWWTPKWYQAIKDGLFLLRDSDGGQMSRDMTLFLDDDGRAYHIYSSEENLTLHIAELSDDYLSHTGRYIRIFPGGHNEAPIMFKHNGKYWMITSGCTGWAPNMARLFCADNIFGKWSQLPSPCIGEKCETTFDAQGAFPLTINGEIYFVADRWNPKRLADSRYLILPILYNAAGTPIIPFLNQIPFPL